MTTIVKWFVRILLTLIFIDWFRMKYDSDGEIKPIGMVQINIGDQQTVKCAFGCSAEDLHDGDIVPMQIRIVNENAKNADT